MYFNGAALLAGMAIAVGIVAGGGLVAWLLWLWAERYWREGLR